MKPKDKKMGAFGKKGYKGLLKSKGLDTPEKVSIFFKKKALKRWKLHPEQRAK